jgi:hypothetical protein
MSRQSPPSRGGIFGLLFVFCLTALLAGLGFDLGASARAHFWIGDQPAAAFAVGVAATLFAILAAWSARAVLGRKARDKDGGSSDAGSHA